MKRKVHVRFRRGDPVLRISIRGSVFWRPERAIVKHYEAKTRKLYFEGVIGGFYSGGYVRNSGDYGTLKYRGKDYFQICEPFDFLEGCDTVQSLYLSVAEDGDGNRFIIQWDKEKRFPRFLKNYSDRVDGALDMTSGSRLKLKSARK